jgi:hypothetical protein
MGKRGKFDRSCYIPHQVVNNRFLGNWDNIKTEREGVAENAKNQKKQAQKRR